MTDYGIVKAESVFQLAQGLAVTFDVQHHIVSFVDLVDRVSQLTTAPIFNTVDSAFAIGHDRAVALDHGRDLFALVRVNQEHNFVMTHVSSLRLRRLTTPIQLPAVIMINAR